MASLDPVAYLRATPPFDALPSRLFDDAARSLEIVYHPTGTHLVERSGKPLEHLYVIRKGAVRLEREGSTLQLLEEGEVFGYTSLIAGRATLDATVEEDLLAYRIPRAEFQRLLADGAFASHFAAGLAERLRHSLEPPQLATFQADLGVAVGDLLRHEAVRVGREATVGEAARVMSRHSVTSAIVDGEPPGIITDRDLRSRVLAAGLGPETPVTQVYTSPIRTTPDRTVLYEAWRILLDSGLHHLPVTRDGEIVGVLSSTDILRHTAQGPVALLRRVERLSSRESLPGYGDQVAEMASSLLAGGLEASVIAGFVARLNGALLRSILRWAEAEQGPPPAPFAWLALGSEGRMEQTLLTDQDNALVYADLPDPEAGREWFARLAARANADLEAAGFPRCPGGYMARGWHGPLSEWIARFEGWIEHPAPQALLEAAIFLDYRRVCGALDLGPLDAVLARASKARVFLQCLAKAALEFRPPASLVLRLRGASSEVDLKTHGISPIVVLARCYGLEAGGPERGTTERMEAAVRAGLVGSDVCATLREAYRFLVGIRLREQIRMRAEGLPVVNTLPLSALSSIERSRLKDSFRAIRDWQETAAYHYRTDLF